MKPMKDIEARPYTPGYSRQALKTRGLYYKHVTIVNDDSSIVSKWSFKLIDDPRVIIYYLHRFIIQATGLSS